MREKGASRHYRLRDSAALGGHNLAAAVPDATGAAPRDNRADPTCERKRAITHWIYIIGKTASLGWADSPICLGTPGQGKHASQHGGRGQRCLSEPAEEVAPRYAVRRLLRRPNDLLRKTPDSRPFFLSDPFLSVATGRTRFKGTSL